MTTERDDLLAALGQARHFLRHTTRDLSDEQARTRTTASRLTLGGLVKHVTDVEERWARFMQGLPGGPSGAGDPTSVASYEQGFTMGPDETLKGLLETYAEVAVRTDAAIAALPDLDIAYPLPPAPWFPPGAAWSARRVILHVTAETAQHAGHADIIRVSLDGALSMG